MNKLHAVCSGLSKDHSFVSCREKEVNESASGLCERISRTRWAGGVLTARGNDTLKRTPQLHNTVNKAPESNHGERAIKQRGILNKAGAHGTAFFKNVPVI